jgi:hypothetical protein
MSSLFGIRNGFNGETALIYTSDIHPGLKGFLYGDPLRRFTSLFYHLSYVLGSAVGDRGSFVPYQIVYAALWELRALLTYLIVKRLMPNRPALALLAGLFAAMHAGDGAINWIGQLNQFGFIFLMLASFAALLRAAECRTVVYATVWAVVSAGAAYLSLWSYETPLPVILAFPVAVAILRWDLVRLRLLWLSGIYLIPAAVFIFDNAHRYFSRAGNSSYQESVTRHSFVPLALASDLWVHVENSIAFWQWPFATLVPDRSADYALAFLLIAIAILIVSTLALYLEKLSPKPFQVDVRLLLFIGVGFGLLIASYLVILVLADNRELWRTEFLPSFAAAWLMAAALYALAGLIRGSVLRIVLLSSALMVVGIFSARAGVNSALFYHSLWERQRLVISSIIANAPRIANGTLIVVRNVDRQNDPFGDNMWLDVALRLAYPETQVAGIYFFRDGSPAPSLNISIVDGIARTMPIGFPTLFHSQPSNAITNIIAFDDDPSTGQAVPVASGPVTIGNGVVPADRYNFCAAVVSAKPAAIAINRYSPIKADRRISCSQETR